MRVAIIILSVLCASSGWAQDDHMSQVEQAKQNVDTYNAMAASHSDKDSIYFYYFRAIQEARKVQYYDGELVACKGMVAYFNEDEAIYDRLEYTFRIVQIYEKNGTQSEKASGFQQLGRLYFNEKIYGKAIENFRKGFKLEGISINEKYDAGIWLTRSLRISNENSAALSTAREVQFDEARLSTLQMISLYKEKAEIYHNLRAYEEELEVYEQIVQISKGTRYQSFEPTAWNNIGFVQKYLGEVNEAKKAFKNTISTASSESIELKATANYNLGLILHNEGKSDSAMVCFQNAYALYDQLNDWSALATNRNMMALSYFHSDDLFNAQKELDAAFGLEKQYNLKEQEAKSHEIQSLFFEDVYDYESSLKSYKRFLSLRDSLLTLERSEENRLLYDQYKAEQLEKELRVVWASDELEFVSLAEERARLEAEQERTAAKMERDARMLRENELVIERSKAELQRLQLVEERLNVENKQRELDLIQRDNELKELALEKERILVAANKKEILYLAQQNEFAEKERLNEKREYQNNLRWILGILFFFIIILLVILIAYRQLRRRKKRIEEQNVIIAESAREITLQREKSDGLLLNILPFAVAEELKSKGVAKPRLYDEVSVGFTDFSGFTMISEILSPEELVAQLDAMFLEFDKIIEKYELQRIKTIGDAYMFAAGLPDPLEDHAKRSIQASIEIRDFIEGFNANIAPTDPQWNIRIGVHSGPVVAGVIGIKKFAYDIWGDTVNTAARMESSGQVGKVNISEVTQNLLNGDFKTEHRGKVQAKNKGAIEMYFVEKA